MLIGDVSAVLILSIFLQNGNLYIDGENYDLEPAPEVGLKRSLNFGDFGIPHFLTRNEINVNSTIDRTRAVDIPDTKEIPGKPCETYKICEMDETKFNSTLALGCYKYTDLK